MIPILVKLAPVAFKVAKAVVVLAPHAIALYQQHKAAKPEVPALPQPFKRTKPATTVGYGRKYPNPFKQKVTK